jgi:CRISPR-associated protein Cmr3
MPTWIIEPRDPLIARDGRLFSATPGARASSVPFPFPSTTTGAARTQAGLDAHGVFDTRRTEEVKGIAVRGPLLVELDEAHAVGRWLLPAPADAVLFDLEPPESDKAMRQRLEPLRLPPGAYTALPDGLVPTGLTRSDPRKPARVPRFWYWERFSHWLTNPSEGEVALAELGHDGPEPEQRAHVRIRSDALTAEEGALFQTRGLEFTNPPRKRLGLAVFSDAALRPGLAPLGGERRLASWRLSQDAPPGCPAAIREAIVQSGACRVVLLTPAHFARGSYPGWLIETRGGVSPTLVAMAVRRAQVVSGWDLEKKRPKPTRRLASAGTVLFVALTGDASAIARWVDSLWMQCVSDTEQDRRDGFGLAVLGTWSGVLQEMEWAL